jgi:hypothetical protein
MAPITDKDGGIAVELRPQIGAIPVYMPGTGDGRDRQYWSEQINLTSSGDNTIHIVPSGKRFFIDTMFLTVPQAGVALRLKSGASDNISGFIRLTAGEPLDISHGENANLKGARNDQNFVINTSGDRFVPYVGGWATGYDETT